MSKNLIIFLSALILFSCNKQEQKKNKKKSQYEIEMEKREKAIDSLYLALGNEFQSEVNWEEYDYKHLYELQEYIEEKNNKFTIKEFYDFEIYKSNTNYICSFKIDNFLNTIYLDLKIPKRIVETIEKENNISGYNIYEVVVIKLDKLKPLTFEFQSEMDDYHSKILIDRYKSLIGTGEILELKFIKEKR